MNKFRRSPPIVGIIGNNDLAADGTSNYISDARNSDAIYRLSRCIPLIIPPVAIYARIEDLMQTFDGFLFTGGRHNVHPSYYQAETTEEHGTFDLYRDALVLPLIRRCVEQGQPVFGICRGLQEINVAFDGTLCPNVELLPGRGRHRMYPDDSFDERFAPRHRVNFSESGLFHRLVGETSILTNSLHRQGIDRPGRNIVVDGYADDGSAEAAYVSNCKGFALAVQWHPESGVSTDPVSEKLFSAFGQAVRTWADAHALDEVQPVKKGC